MESQFLDLKKYIGVLSFKGTKTGTQKGTACLFFYNKEWLLATAAHCIFDIESEEFNKDFKFLIPYNKVKIELSNVIFHENWLKLYAPEYDIAFFKIVHTDYLECLDDTFLQPKFDISHDNSFSLAGYSASLLLFNRLTIECNRHGKYDQIYNSTLIGVETKAKGGMSGSTLMILDKYKFKIVGTVSLSFKSQKNTLWSAKWNAEMKEILDFITLDNGNKPNNIVSRSNL